MCILKQRVQQMRNQWNTGNVSSLYKLIITETFHLLYIYTVSQKGGVKFLQ